MAVFYSVVALQLPMGKTTVMHLVARENLPEPNSQGESPGGAVLSKIMRGMRSPFYKNGCLYLKLKMM